MCAPPAQTLCTRRVQPSSIAAFATYPSVTLAIGFLVSQYSSGVYSEAEALDRAIDQSDRPFASPTLL